LAEESHNGTAGRSSDYKFLIFVVLFRPPREIGGQAGLFGLFFCSSGFQMNLAESNQPSAEVIHIN